MTYDQYKELCLSIKNDISFEEFRILCTHFNYTDDYIENIWVHFCSKPLEFVMYHDLGKEVFNYLKSQKTIMNF